MSADGVRPGHGLKGEALRFAVAGVAGLLADTAVLYLLLSAGLGWAVARLLSFLAAVWVTWQINRRYTFAPANTSLWQEWWRYLLAMTGGGVVNYGAYSAVMLAAPWLSFVPPLLLPLCAVAAGSLAGMTLNFVSAKFLVFSR